MQVILAWNKLWNQRLVLCMLWVKEEKEYLISYSNKWEGKNLEKQLVLIK
jgi:hypothetical protein